MTLPYLKMIPQQGKADCGVVCLAMLLGKPYLEVYAAAHGRRRPHPEIIGMDTLQLKQAAKKFGITLALKRSWDPDTACGLLTVEKIDRGPHDFQYHLVLLKFGLIFDTDLTVWEPDVYYSTQKFRPVSLIVEQE